MFISLRKEILITESGARLKVSMMFSKDCEQLITSRSRFKCLFILVKQLFIKFEISLWLVIILLFAVSMMEFEFKPLLEKKRFTVFQKILL